VSTTKERTNTGATTPELATGAVAPARTITPPATTPIAQEQSGLDACVHCGFCLPACPTYLTLEDENDSPRGRIVLMRALAEEALAPTDESLRTHIDRCLGCRACETACPSGVPYGNLLEATRATLRGGKAPTLLARLILWTFAHPVAMKVAMAMGKLLAATPIPTLAAKLPGRLGFAMAMLSSTEPPIERAGYTPTPTGERGSAALLTGCVMEGIFTETNRATERVLVKNGYAMTPAPGQRCCGALHAHAGDLETARALARKNVEAFERSGAEYVVANAAGCGAMMKEYGHLLAGDPEWGERAKRVGARVRDVSELLAAAGPEPGGFISFNVAYDPPCHLMHAQRVVNPPLAVLGAVPGLALVPLDEPDQCCGSAGIYNLVQPETSDAVLERKLEDIGRSGATLVATGNPGCLMQIGAGLLRADMKARVVHPVDLLDASYAAL
jgi:glycolate oxidase iron-sulfur subunit